MLAVFVVETNSNNKSDDIYVRKYLKSFYVIDSGDDVIRTVYLGGKDKYDDSAKKKEINNLRLKYLSMYRTDRRIAVFYCIDTDDISRGPDANENRRKAKEIEEFCRRNGYEFIWFHEVIEQAFIGKRVSSNEKKSAAERFAKRNLSQFGRSKLCCSDYSLCKMGTSNLDTVLRRHFKEKVAC